MLVTITFANENPQENGVFRKMHNLFLFWQYCESKNASNPYRSKAVNERQERIQTGFEPVSIPDEIERL
jgi:hypothetical protein